MYNLRSLGWYNFQQLCVTIAQEVLGQTVERFLDTHDGGQDGAFICNWTALGDEVLVGSVVFQCKFTSKTDRSIRPSDLTDELEKVERLVATGDCDSYVLMTNADLTGTRALEIKSLLRSVGVKHVLTLGSTWICEQIQKNNRLRMLVPRVYGLGDLSQILDERAYEQSQAILDSMHEDLSKVIVTDAHRHAAEAMDKHGFVLLLGEPASGKTTIASMLAVAATDKWGANLLKVDGPRHLIDHWNPSEPSQFFWIDDAFGVNQYQYSTTNAWNQALASMNSMLAKGAKIIMTSRDYIYNRAKNDLKLSVFPLLSDSQVVIDVQGLTETEKQTILYNHLKHGKQPREFRTEIKPFLEKVARSPRFIPETARRLSEPTFTRDFVFSEHYVDRFVELREQHLIEVLKSLDSESQAALALIYMRNNAAKSPLQLTAHEQDALHRLGGDLSTCIAALDALDNSMVSLARENGRFFWRFKHPTIGDAYSQILAERVEHLGIFVQGTSPDRLLDLVSCGDVGIERSVVLPEPFFEEVIDKVEIIGRYVDSGDKWLNRWEQKRKVMGFLASRCSKEFLGLFLQRHPEITEKTIDVTPFVGYSPELKLARRLKECGFLPEVARRDLASKLAEYAIEYQDACAIADPDARKILTELEYSELIDEIRSEVLPRLDDIRWEFQSNSPSGYNPDDYILPLVEYFEALRETFIGDIEIHEKLGTQIDLAWEWAFDEMPYDEESERTAYGAIAKNDSPSSTRSIFDDVDE